MSDAYIYDAVRTPRGRGKTSGSLHTVRPVDLLKQTLVAIKDRNDLDTSQVDDVVVGCVTQTGDQGACIARTAALLAGYDDDAPGVTLNRFCGSGLEAVNHAAAMVASGFYDCIVAGGVESMSRVKMGSDGGALFDPATEFELGVVPQGVSADLLATLRGVTRDEADAFAVRSQDNATMAWEKRHFDKSIIPVTSEGLTLLAKDEHIRPGTSVESLAKLRPSFEMMGKQFGLDTLTRKAYPHVEQITHIHHAGNSSGIVDGAAAVLVANTAKGEALGLTPRARIRSVAVCGDEPILMLDGPIPATRRALAKAKMSIDDIDLVEVNEAFATVPLAWLKAFPSFDPDHLNVDGGAIAMGHPLGATGAMLLNTVLDALERRDLNTGLVTLCIGGGMGIATIIERV